MVLVGAGLDKKLLDFAFFETSGQKRSDACDELATVEGIGGEHVGGAGCVLLRLFDIALAALCKLRLILSVAFIHLYNRRCLSSVPDWN